jgi:hypothetical protein
VGDPTISVVVDDDVYGAAADVYSQRFLDRLVAGLADQGLITLDGDEPTVSFIYGLAFTLFAILEDHQVPAEGMSVPHLAFASRAIAPDRLVIGGNRTFLHGRLDDPAILQAIDKARGGGP